MPPKTTVPTFGGNRYPGRVRSAPKKLEDDPDWNGVNDVKRPRKKAAPKKKPAPKKATNKTTTKKPTTKKPMTKKPTTKTAGDKVKGGRVKKGVKKGPYINKPGPPRRIAPTPVDPTVVRSVSSPKSSPGPQRSPVNKTSKPKPSGPQTPKNRSKVLKTPKKPRKARGRTTCRSGRLNDSPTRQLMNDIEDFARRQDFGTTDPGNSSASSNGIPKTSSSSSDPKTPPPAPKNENKGKRNVSFDSASSPSAGHSLEDIPYLGNLFKTSSRSASKSSSSCYPNSSPSTGRTSSTKSSSPNSQSTSSPRSFYTARSRQDPQHLCPSVRSESSGSRQSSASSRTIQPDTPPGSRRSSRHSSASARSVTSSRDSKSRQSSAASARSQSAQEDDEPQSPPPTFFDKVVDFTFGLIPNVRFRTLD